MQFPAAFILARQQTEEHLASARPDAPVVPEHPQRTRTPRQPRFGGLRRAAANGLRGLATRVEPRHDCQAAL
ncbi:hypothetical protein HDA40_001077 [Hamadaea flava]|uniref:Uncharacterized protein n=1 Tax=Hamadaea flava TaxID=1742688 RepID=A0ABV8LP89_9ACTN|nr:hypothetical protein [Hamadaea flava]MCP2322570.1 hypothetical protein [Hamadaea flava]